MERIIPEHLQKLAKQCNQVDYHLTNELQACYVVLVFDLATLKLSLLSENYALFFKENSLELGMHIKELLSEESYKHINLATNHFTQKIFTDQILVHTLYFKEQSLPCDVVIYQSGDHYLVLEFALLHSSALDFDATHASSMNRLVKYQGNSLGFTEELCKTIAEIIHFDRVWCCQFDQNDGYVNAEYNEGALPSLLHHRFPYTDVPDKIRQLFTKHKFRFIYDIHDTPIRLVGLNKKSSDYLDLSLSVARHPAKSHIHYLSNMHISSSVSFAVIKNGSLYALFGGHNKVKQFIHYRKLLACQMLVDHYLAHYQLLKKDEELAFMAQNEKKLDESLLLIEHNEFNFMQLAALHDSALHSLFCSDGFIYCDGTQCYSSLALTYDEEAVLRDLLTRISAHHKPFAAHTNRELAPWSYPEKFCGILLIPLDTQKGECIVWYKKERAYSEKWAGNPSEAVINTEQGSLGPRRSFETWAILVTGTSGPWTEKELSLAQRFQAAYDLRKAIYTSRKQTEVAEQAVAYKNQFLAKISHELITPLHAQIGFINALIEKNNTLSAEKKLSYLNILKESSERSLHLIKDLLDLSKSAAQTLLINLQDIALDDLLCAVLQEIRPRSDEKKVMIVTTNLEGLIIYGDKQRMIQVLINLVNNALKFSSSGQRISVNGFRHKNKIRLCISDEGPGIAPEELELIFQPFMQSSHYHPNNKGSGLGLSICKELIEKQNGCIWAENNPQGGASFYVECAVPPLLTT